MWCSCKYGKSPDALTKSQCSSEAHSSRAPKRPAALHLTQWLPNVLSHRAFVDRCHQMEGPAVPHIQRCMGGEGGPSRLSEVLGEGAGHVHTTLGHFWKQPGDTEGPWHEVPQGVGVGAPRRRKQGGVKMHKNKRTGLPEIIVQMSQRVGTKRMLKRDVGGYGIYRLGLPTPQVCLLHSCLSPQKSAERATVPHHCTDATAAGSKGRTLGCSLCDKLLG